jgi:hypothetical protein
MGSSIFGAPPIFRRQSLPGPRRNAAQQNALEYFHVNLPREDVSSAGREQRSGADIREDAAIALHVSLTVTCGNFSLSIAIKIAPDESKQANRPCNCRSKAVVVLKPPDRTSTERVVRDCVAPRASR